MDQKSERNLVWIDMEMTGLNVETEEIMEVCVVITDGDLNVIKQGKEICIHISDEKLAGMDDWCTEHHGKVQIYFQILKQLILNFSLD